MKLSIPLLHTHYFVFHTLAFKLIKSLLLFEFYTQTLKQSFIHLRYRLKDVIYTPLASNTKRQKTRHTSSHTKTELYLSFLLITDANLLTS